MSAVRLYISCTNLVDGDCFGRQSDPFAVFQMREDGAWGKEIETERIENEHNPIFQTAIEVRHRFAVRQFCRIRMFDHDRADESDFLGEIFFNLSEVLRCKGAFDGDLRLETGDVAGNSRIRIRAQAVPNPSDIVNIHFRGENLDKKEVFGTCDPYYVISKNGNKRNPTRVCKSNVVENTLTPNWEAVSLSLRDLCDGDFNKILQIDVYDEDVINDDYVGGFGASLKSLMDSQGNERFELVNNEKTFNSGYINSGSVYSYITIEKTHSFLEYTMDDLDINVTVGIDFTLSNGASTHRHRQHHVDKYRPNEYVRAISAFGDVLSDYDSDKLFPVYGFGAKRHRSPDVSHEFHVNLNPRDPNCYGVDGILDAYQRCLRNIWLSEPAHVTPIVNKVIHTAEESLERGDSKKYHILLLLVNSVPDDFDEVRAAFERASSLPVSVVIVGMGAGSYAGMGALDATDGGLKLLCGKTAEREIVQFVSFRNYEKAPGAVSRAVLSELPTQIEEYFYARGVKPCKFR